MYGNAKLANILFTREPQRQWGSNGVSAVAFDRGAVASNFVGNTGGALRWIYLSPLARRVLTKTEEGGKRLVFLADGTPREDWVLGAHYENDRVTKTHRLATNPRLAQELWVRSAQMVQLG